jgi:hypothetical protein
MAVASYFILDLGPPHKLEARDAPKARSGLPRTKGLINNNLQCNANRLPDLAWQKKHGISESPRNAVAHRNVFCRSVFGNTAMAQAFRISERGVQRLAIYEGMPRKSRGEYPYFECLSWFIAHLQKKFCRDCDEPIRAGPCRGSEAAARRQCQLGLSFMDVQCWMKHNCTSLPCSVPDLL